MTDSRSSPIDPPLDGRLVKARTEPSPIWAVLLEGFGIVVFVCGTIGAFNGEAVTGALWSIVGVLLLIAGLLVSVNARLAWVGRRVGR